MTRPYRRKRVRQPRSREYRAWCAAKTRCYNLNVIGYALYGGRGITMCPEWADNFTAFLRDAGECPSGRSLDRYPDTDGNYEPGNVRWATDVEQARNMRSNRRTTFNGETLCTVEWAERLGIPADTLKRRLLLGWGTERALTEPLRKPGRKEVTCHPDMLHYARGLCEPCYGRWRRGDSA